MLARNSWFTSPPCGPLPDLDYSGFPFWVALAAEPNRENRSADWLEDKLNIHVYWPHFMVQRHHRGRAHVPIARSVVPGMLFAPLEIMDIERRDEILDWAHLRQVRLGRPITKAEVEVIREIEAGLNTCRVEKTAFLLAGDHVRFLDPVKAAFLGYGTIFDVANKQGIGVKLSTKLIGTDEIYVSAAELEVMQPCDTG